MPPLTPRALVRPAPPDTVRLQPRGPWDSYNFTSRRIGVHLAEARATRSTFFDGGYRALSGGSLDNPDTGIFAYVDLDSAVEMVNVEARFKNNDAWSLSVQIYKAAGGKLHFVPWDPDLSLGQPSYNDSENTNSWVLYRPDWIARMGRVPA